MSKAAPVRRASVLNLTLDQNVQSGEDFKRVGNCASEEIYDNHNFLPKRGSRRLLISSVNSSPDELARTQRRDGNKVNNSDHKLNWSSEADSTSQDLHEDISRVSTANVATIYGTTRKEKANVGEVAQHRLTSNAKAGPNGLFDVKDGISLSDSSGIVVKETVQWSKVKTAILFGQNMKTLGSQKSHAGSIVSSTIKQTTLQKTVSGRRNKMDAKNLDAEGDGGNQAAPSLIEDPILVKICKKNRNVGKFTCKPEPIPHAVCFEISGTGLRHIDVKLQVEKLLEACPEVKIVRIQFHHRALVNDQRLMNNRWIITTNSITGRNRLSGNYLNFNGLMVQLQPYDDVIKIEYQQFMRMTNFVKMMDSTKILS